MISENFSDHFVKPSSTYNFSNISSLIFNLLLDHPTKMPEDVLGGYKKSEKIVFFLIDGFGWNLLKSNLKTGAVNEVVKNGKLTKLTTQFPSTTTAQVTSINSAKSVGEHGLYEWNCYEPSIDKIITPIPFSFPGSKESELLKNTKLNPGKLFPKKTIYTLLKENKVNSFVLQDILYSISTYNKQIFRDSELIPFKSVTEGLVKLADKMNSTKGKSYFYFYFSAIDSMEHAYGPNSPYVTTEIENFFMQLNRFFLKRIKSGDNSLMILSADHGMANINPQTTIYLDKKIPEISSYIQINKNNELLVPAGSPRDMFLHIKEDFLDQAMELLSKKLKNKAEVVKSAELISHGFFGENLSDSFLKRVGNLVILPYEGESVWWYGDGRFEQKFLGHHGGLTPNEMEIPLFVKKI